VNLIQIAFMMEQSVSKFAIENLPIIDILETPKE